MTNKSHEKTHCKVFKITNKASSSTQKLATNVTPNAIHICPCKKKNGWSGTSHFVTLVTTRIFMNSILTLKYVLTSQFSCLSTTKRYP